MVVVGGRLEGGCFMLEERDKSAKSTYCRGGPKPCEVVVVDNGVEW